MKQDSLYNFYEHAVLPQFGIQDEKITWSGSHRAGGDEFVHYFMQGVIEYALVFEDHVGLGKNEDFIREHVLDNHSGYEIVEPQSQTSDMPSYDGFRLPAPSRYCENVTGNFTLIQLQS